MTQTVLVIESDSWLGDQYQQGLEKEGFAVVRASNAYTAVDMIDEQPPAAIVTGLLLSGGGGLGLLHELQSYIDTAKIPIIICASMPDMSLEDLEPYGVKHIIDSTTMKPADLAAAVRSSLA
jgi:DNA-binding response OmpR family regulator